MSFLKCNDITKSDLVLVRVKSIQKWVNDVKGIGLFIKVVSRK